MNKIFNNKLFLYLTILLLLVYIFFERSCSDSKIITKKESVIKYDTIKVFKELPSKIITKYKTKEGKIIYLPGKVDTLEIKTFEKAPDSTQFKMFTDATKIRQYTQVFKDSLADVSIFAETKGELVKMAPTVTLKAILPEKKTTFALYGGGGLYLYNLEKLNYKFNLRFQNKKGDLISGSYDPFTKTGFIDYDFRFINIRK